MRLALILRGYCDQHHLVAENFNTNIITSLQQFGEVDIYISTYNHPNISLLSKYNPVLIECQKNGDSWKRMVVVHTLTCLIKIQESQKPYDYIIAIRLDAQLEYELGTVIKKHNVFSSQNSLYYLCNCETKDWIDDNLWIFSGSLVSDMRDVLNLLLAKADISHRLKFAFKSLPNFLPLFPGNYELKRGRPYMTFARELMKK